MIKSSSFISKLRPSPNLINRVRYSPMLSQMRQAMKADPKFAAKATGSERLAERVGFWTIPAYLGYRVLQPKRQSSPQISYPPQY